MVFKIKTTWHDTLNVFYSLEVKYKISRYSMHHLSSSSLRWTKISCFILKSWFKYILIYRISTKLYVQRYKLDPFPHRYVLYAKLERCFGLFMVHIFLSSYVVKNLFSNVVWIFLAQIARIWGRGYENWNL